MIRFFRRLLNIAPKNSDNVERFPCFKAYLIKLQM